MRKLEAYGYKKSARIWCVTDAVAVFGRCSLKWSSGTDTYAGSDFAPHGLRRDCLRQKEKHPANAGCFLNKLPGGDLLSHATETQYHRR